MEGTKEKYCRRCKKTLNISMFSVMKNGKPRFLCKSCIKEYKKEKYRENPAKAIESAIKWKENNLERYKQNQDKYRFEHRHKLNNLAKEYRKNNKDTIRKLERMRSKTQARKIWIKNYRERKMVEDPIFREKILASGKRARIKYYSLHKNTILNKLKTKYWENPEYYRMKTKESVTKWRENHPDRARFYNKLRVLAHRRAKIEKFEDNNYIDILRKWQHNLCYHCNSLLNQYHIDHLIPLSKNGIHSPDNIVLSCSTCNLSKHDKLLWREWVPQVNIVENYFISNKEIESLPLKVLSTFFISERNGINSYDLLSKLKIEYPNYMFIFDMEWFHRRSAIDNILLHKLNKDTKVYARKTTIENISVEDARIFLDTYHLQGFGRGTVHLGLVYNNELVGISSWLENSGTIELNRLCFKESVVGGFSKMLYYFVKNLLPSDIPLISFVDPRYATGNSYEKVGFNFIGETQQPVYYYVNGAGLYHRRIFMKDRMAKKLLFFDSNLTEVENTKINGLYRVYGLKQRKYLYNRP